MGGGGKALIMWDMRLSFSDLRVGRTLRNSLLIFSTVGMLVDVGEQSLEGWNEGGGSGNRCA